MNRDHLLGFFFAMRDVVFFGLHLCVIYVMFYSQFCVILATFSSLPFRFNMCLHFLTSCVWSTVISRVSRILVTWQPRSFYGSAAVFFFTQLTCNITLDCFSSVVLLRASIIFSMS